MVQVLSRKSAVRRREILSCAASVFRECGYAGAGMREIAARLGIAVGKLYYYFESKEDLLLYCQESALAVLLAGAETIRRAPLPAAGRLYGMIALHLECIHEIVPGSLAHLETAPARSARGGRVRAMAERYEREFREAIEEGIGEGVFQADDARLAARTILGALNSSARWYEPGGRLTLKAIARTMGGLLLRGVLAAGADFTGRREVEEWIANRQKGEPCDE